MSRNPYEHFRHNLPDAVRILSPFSAYRPMRAPSSSPPTYWKPPAEDRMDLTRTLWGTASSLTMDARLHLMSVASDHPSPSEWMRRIEAAAQHLYLPPRVPAPDWLFTDPSAWHSSRVSARLDRCLASWPQIAWPSSALPAALLCWPVRHLHECLLDVPDGAPSNPLAHVTCPANAQEPVDGPYLFFGIVTRAQGAWVCSDRCAYPIASLDFPLPVDSDHHRDAAPALHRLLCTLRDNTELAYMLGGQLHIEIERPLYTLNLRGGACAPDFLIHVHRPEETRHPRITPHHLDPRDRVLYTVELTGLDDPEYEAARRRFYPALQTLGPMFHMHVPDFHSDDNSIDRQREVLTAEIAMDILRRWRVRRLKPAHSTASPKRSSP